ncbi:hypothetical protein KY290_009839 [Solanum tuberosum]|uniref:UDP-glucosyltransferase n=1 Tax=Solanum tuberosum TaxID=4113 RepID=A0ABQ7VW21_SOLTU|nr:hypothetical protein KY289_010220 [Solanum tuberosum]KAH0772702.1 hypothetical protein KY290_009839 [Solanum tuberosum]
MENAIGEILVVPFFGQGHVLPLTELCKKLSSLNFKTTFILSSDISSSISSSLVHHPLVNVTDVDAPIPPPPRPEIKFDPQPIMMYYKQMRQVDLMILPHFGDVFTKFQVPIVAFSPFSAASLAMDYAAWKADVEFIIPGETRFLPGLPDEMGMDYGDIVRSYYNSSEEPLIGTKKKSFPTQPGDEPVWVQEVNVTSAILVNTYDVLEHTFLEYLAKQTRLPIYGIGLLPEKFCELLPTLQEHEEISKALVELSSQNFIWVKKDEIIQGIKRLMEDKQVHNRVKELSDKFGSANFPVGSIANLHDFKDFIMQAK